MKASKTSIIDYDELRSVRLKRAEMFKTSPKTSIIQISVNTKVLHNYYKEAKASGFTFYSDEPAVGNKDERGLELGTGKGPRALEYFLAGLGFCHLGIVTGYAAVMEVHVESLEATVRAYLDQKGIYGLREDYFPLEKVEITTKIKSNESKERVTEMVRTAEKRCPAHGTFLTHVHIESKIVINDVLAT